jgi:hypothetical protein
VGIWQVSALHSACTFAVWISSELSVVWCAAVLQAMYTRPDEFGGSLFSLAVSVMTDLIHHEPQSFRQLNEAGLPDAFLTAIKVSQPGHRPAWRRLA